MYSRWAWPISSWVLASTAILRRSPGALGIQSRSVSPPISSELACSSMKRNTLLAVLVGHVVVGLDDAAAVEERLELGDRPPRSTHVRVYAACGVR